MVYLWRSIDHFEGGYILSLLGVNIIQQRQVNTSYPEHRHSPELVKLVAAHKFLSNSKRDAVTQATENTNTKFDYFILQYVTLEWELRVQPKTKLFGVFNRSLAHALYLYLNILISLDRLSMEDAYPWL